MRSAAAYSNVPVFEMMCRGISVMRRRVDSFFNATQILKVAGVDKARARTLSPSADAPQVRRTKIIDRDIVNGVHEKVQGGYGKYQGTR